jgi:hypothetical protein
LIQSINSKLSSSKEFLITNMNSRMSLNPWILRLRESSVTIYRAKWLTCLTPTSQVSKIWSIKLKWVIKKTKKRSFRLSNKKIVKKSKFLKKRSKLRMKE